MPPRSSAYEGIFNMTNKLCTARGSSNADWCGHRWMQVRRALPEIEDCNLHILWHTFACRLLDKGVDLYTLSKLLGHSSLRVTERYAPRVRNGGAEQAIAALQRRPVPLVGGRGPAGPQRLHMWDAVPRRKSVAQG
jgi:Phage integrase family